MEMSSTKSSRPTSTSSSLLQDVAGSLPGAFPGSTAPPTSSNHQSLSQAVHARRSEYTKLKNIKIKIGTWNTAAYKGAEKDVAWFVSGKGVAEALTDLHVTSQSESNQDASQNERTSLDDRETVEEQEARYARKQSTLPKNDPGSLPGGDDISLYVLGLQEIVDVNSAAEALRPYTDPSVAQKWKNELEAALPKGYKLVAEQQLIGMLLLVYASEEVASDVKAVSTTSVGTGLMGYMGNKGAVTARIVLGETTRLVFVNCHLAAGADKGSVDRRNWDYSQVMSRTKFDPIQDSMDLSQNTGEGINDADFAFFMGDLNYRLEGIPGEDVRRLLMLHTRNEYDLSQIRGKKIDSEIARNKAEIERRKASRNSTDSGVSQTSIISSVDEEEEESTQEEMDEGDRLEAENDPASLQTTLASLLPHDELHQQQKARKAFQDWKEGPITFLPTYKYDAGSVGVFDSSEKRRAPSWCDRILWRTRRDMLTYESMLTEEVESRKKDEEMKTTGVDEAAKDEELLYDYDPDEDAEDDGGFYNDDIDASQGTVITKEGFEDEIALESYVAHQRVLSSDHKPLDAIFSFKYDAVVPELKSQIHQEVARELDRAENEGRPSVTVVVDRPHSNEIESTDKDPSKFEGVWFGEVRYAMHKHRSLTIANTGQVAASVEFIDRPVGPGQAPGIAPVWVTLRIDDGSGKLSTDLGKRTLEPGVALNVELEIRILDVGLARAFNEGTKAMDDILVLRVENGRDHFIPLRGTWLESSLGHSISKLVRIPEGGIRKLQRQRPDSSKSNRSASSSISEDQVVKWSAPRELFRLTEAVEDLTVRSTAEWSMISGDQGQRPPWEKTAGWPFASESWTTTDPKQRGERIAAACDALDQDIPFDQTLPRTLTHLERLESLGEFLRLFLEAMPDGVVTEALWEQLNPGLIKAEKERKLSAEEQRTWAQEILSQAPSHSISFILITSMLDRVVHEVTSAHGEWPQKLPDAGFSAAMRPALSRRQTVSKDPATARKQIIIKALATIFANAMIRTQVPVKEKDKLALEERKMKFMELFLSRDEPC